MLAVRLEADHLSRVHKGKAEILCHDNAVQIFPAGSSVIGACLFLKIFLNGLKFLIQRKFQPEPVNNFLISVPNGLHLFRKVGALLRQIIAGIKHVRHLRVVRGSLTGCRRHYKFTFPVRPDNLAHFFKLLCTRKRASAKFNNLVHLFIYPPATP